MPVAAEVVLNSLFRLAPSYVIVVELEPFAVAKRIDERKVASVVAAAGVNLITEKRQVSGSNPSKGTLGHFLPALKCLTL